MSNEKLNTASALKIISLSFDKDRNWVLLNKIFVEYNLKKKINGLNCAFLLILLNKENIYIVEKKMVNLRDKISFKENYFQKKF